MKKFLLSAALAAFAFNASAEETVFFESNFSKIFEPFKDFVGSGDNAGKSLDAVGDNDPGAYLPKMITPKATINGVDNMTPAKVMIELGWDLIGPKNDADGYINFQKFYLKMGTTTKQGSVTLPKIPELGDGTENVWVSYDWCPWKQGETSKTDPGKFDDAQVVIIVKNGDNEVQFPQPGLSLPTGSDLKWHKVNVELKGVKLDKESRITIRNIDQQFGENGTTKGWYRYFLNNIKVYKENSSSVNEIEVTDNIEPQYFNLQGVKVSNPEKGIYIRVTGNKAEKIVL